MSLIWICPKWGEPDLEWSPADLSLLVAVVVAGQNEVELGHLLCQADVVGHPHVGQSHKEIAALQPRGAMVIESDC